MKKLLFVLVILLFPAFGLAAEIGAPAPDFKLKNYDGKEISLAEFRGKPVVLEWYNPGCPFVKKHYGSGAMQALQKEATAKGAVWLTVNSTNEEHDDFIAADKVDAHKSEQKIAATAYVLDKEGTVGKAYGARTTPHMFVVDKDGKLAYQGAIDDSPRPSGDPKSAKNYISAALDELASGKPVSTPETKPYGCSVKFK